MFKVNNRNTRTRCKICSKLTIKTPERRLCRPLPNLKVLTGINWDALRNLVPFVQFKKTWKHLRRSVTKGKTLLKVTLFYGRFSSFLNCAYGIKSRKASQLLSRNGKIKSAKFFQFCWVFYCSGCHILPLIIWFSKLPMLLFHPILQF